MFVLAEGRQFVVGEDRNYCYTKEVARFQRLKAVQRRAARGGEDYHVELMPDVGRSVCGGLHSGRLGDGVV
ncbi:hypothetical protein [Kutzneria chonburiensis]|uniref:hypothetical protein n=1 Tax=Kutzneria chonburiensis TaxID=1483604 RepID=UPI00236124E3|nr:hypothetical protein [Kutzneria chonburiensis]